MIDVQTVIASAGAITVLGLGITAYVTLRHPKATAKAICKMGEQFPDVDPRDLSVALATGMRPKAFIEESGRTNGELIGAALPVSAIASPDVVGALMSEALASETPLDQVNEAGMQKMERELRRLPTVKPPHGDNDRT